MNKNFFLMFIAVGMSLFTACSDDEGKKGPFGDDEVLSGEITQNVTLKSGQTYKLDGVYRVKNGATLTIEPGVTIVAQYDEIVDYILVEQGGKINAIGSASNPIVMTSDRKSPGAWGGIHICGRAHTNVEGGVGYSEVGNARYGGNDDSDNSGTLRYVRVEYTGYTFDEEHEANGISFYGVGNGTTVDHCEAYKGSDDGFEFFGGSVNISNMVVVNCSDDSFDWTEGWNGTGTNLMAYQENISTLGYECDCLIEADNNGTNNEASPVAHPKLSNLLLVGNGENGHGVRLREGTQVTMNNARICGKSMPLTVETLLTENALKNGTSSLSNITISAALVSNENVYTNNDFLAGLGNSVNTNLSFASLSDVIEACDWIEGNWVKE